MPLRRHDVRPEQEYDRVGRRPTEPHLQAATLPAFLGLSKADAAGVGKWKARAYEAMLANFLIARDARPSPLWSGTKAPPSDVAALKRLAAEADSAMPAGLLPWREAAGKFYDDYLYEQLRLAALFTKVSSEIFTYSPKEIQGDGYPDKAFLLTFDDGPTQPGGGTDSLIAWLKRNRLDGTFFMLGGNLRHRLGRQGASGVQALYAGMCTASHGAEHKSHAKWDQWRSSIRGPVFPPALWAADPGGPVVAGQPGDQDDVVEPGFARLERQDQRLPGRRPDHHFNAVMEARHPVVPRRPRQGVVRAAYGDRRAGGVGSAVEGVR